MRFRLLPVLLVAAGCGGASGQAQPEHPRPTALDAQSDSARVRALDSVRLADVPAGTFGPYFAETPLGSVVTWAAAGRGGARAWHSISLDPKGKPTGASHVLGPAPSEVGLAIVEPASRADPKAGYVLLSTRRDGGRTLIEARRLAPNAELVAGPIKLADVTGDVIWLDLCATDSVPLALYGVRQADGADLYALPVPSRDAAPGVAKPIAAAARAWQATPHGTAAAVGLVLGTPGAGSGGRVEVAFLDETGAVTSRVPVSPSPSAEADLDMAEIGNGLLLAWSDHRDIESRVYLAAVDSGGKLSRPPSPAVPAVGEQALIRLVAPHDPGGPAYLAWENLLERPARGRSILLAPVTSDGNVGAERAELFHEANDSVPELVASKNGLGILTLASACHQGQECTNAPLLPTYVELDRKLALVVSEPVKLTALAGEAPDLAWGLGCASDPCHVLAAQASDPAPVYRVSLAAFARDWQPAVHRPTPPSPPRAVALEAIASLDPLADIALTRLDKTPLAAWVTYFDPSTPFRRLTKPAPDGRFDPPRALLQVRALPEGVTPPPEPITISTRARSAGGVAFAAAPSPPHEALLGWAALDNKIPQVFVTVVDDKAKKLRQRMLTRAPGEKTDVSVAGLADGWLVAWVDERSGDPEVYAQKVNRQLVGAGPEKRITSAKGSAADVATLARGQDVFVAWSDARDAERAGWADIFVAVLKGGDASPLAPEQVVAKTPLHSHSPVLAAFGDGALLAFIDSSPADAGGTGAAQVQLAELDAKGRPRAQPIAVTPPQGTPTAVAANCDGDRCHLVMSVAIGDGGILETFDYSASGTTRPKRLVSLTGPSSSAVTPALLGRELLYADRAESTGRVRHMLIEWR